MEFNDNIDYWIERYKTFTGRNVVGNAHWTEEQYKKENEGIMDNFEAALSIISDKTTKVLDFGCGIGRWESYLSSHIDRYFGTDIIENSENISGTFELLKDSKIPFKNNKFDLIWTCVVLQHVIDDDLLKHYVEQFHKRLTKNGHVIMTENVFDKESTNYLKFRNVEDYVNLMTSSGFKLISNVQVIWGKEPHNIMVYKKV